MLGRAAIDRAAATVRVLGDVGRDFSLAERFDKGAGVVAPVGPESDTLPRPSATVEHHERRISFGRAIGLADEDVEDEPVAVLHQDVTAEAELRLLATALARDPGLWVSR